MNFELPSAEIAPRIEVYTGIRRILQRNTSTDINSMNETNDWHFLNYQRLDEVTPFPNEPEPWKSMVFIRPSIRSVDPRAMMPESIQVSDPQMQTGC